MLRRLLRLCISKFPPMIESEIVSRAKKAMRTRVLARRSKLSLEYRKNGSASLLRAAAALPEFPARAALAGFMPIRDEIDPTLLMERYHERGHPIGLPIVVAPRNPLIFRQWQPGDALEKGAFDVPVPMEQAERVVPRILLVPLAAFDREGYRLGYGAGFYDRTLTELRARDEVIAIGVAFDEQEVDAVPRDEYDQQLDWMLTPSGAFRTKPEIEG